MAVPMTSSDLSLKVSLCMGGQIPRALFFVELTCLLSPLSRSQLACMALTSGHHLEAASALPALCERGYCTKSAKGLCGVLQIDAIFRHESQKDRALFPGADPREFWQRARDRNEVRMPL